MHLLVNRMTSFLTSSFQFIHIEAGKRIAKPFCALLSIQTNAQDMGMLNWEGGYKQY